jgi:hypothetical protein
VVSRLIALIRPLPGLLAVLVLAAGLAGCGASGADRTLTRSGPDSGGTAQPASGTTTQPAQGTSTQPASGTPAEPIVGTSGASCAALTPAQLRASARLIVIGTFLPGPTASTGGERLLTSPARFRVAHYLKGHGPRVVTVLTGIQRRSGGVALAEDGVVARVGERWKIFSAALGSPVQTSRCAGSHRLATAR